MERAAAAPLRSLITALAVVFAIAAIWVAAALADGSSDTGSSARSDGAQADLIQNQDEAPQDEEDEGLPFDEEDDFFRGGDGLFDEDCPFGEGERGFGDGPNREPDEDPEAEPEPNSDADL